MKITIRNAVPGDNVKIYPLQQETLLLHHQGRPELFRDVAQHYPDAVFEEMLGDPEHFVFIAETDGGEAAGYAISIVKHYRDDPVYRDFDLLYIDDICVLEKYRGQGIGGLLFDRCRETAAELKCRILDLDVWSFNDDAVAFYRKRGMSEMLLRMNLRLED